MAKLKSRLYILTILLAMTSLSLVLVSSGYQRNLFYIAIYCSIVGLILEYKAISFRQFSIALPILLIGLAMVVWYFGYEYRSAGMDFYDGHLMAGKKIILASLLVFYIDKCKHYVSAQKFQQWLAISTGLGLILATTYGIWQALHGMPRIEMGINRSTASAYVYSALAIVFIYSLYSFKNTKGYIAAGITIVVSYIIVILTGTRTAIGLHLIIILLMTLYSLKKINLKSSLIVFFLTAGVFAACFKPYIEPKIQQTIDEVASFNNGNDNSSLGARFSMWTVGIYNGMAEPFGQSMASRVKVTEQFVQTHPQHQTALVYIDVHLHNELIDTFSLQGVPGLVLLLAFFILLMGYSLYQQNTLLLFSTLPLFLYGLTDVLLTSSEIIMFFLALFALGAGNLFTKRQIM